MSKVVNPSLCREQQSLSGFLTHAAGEKGGRARLPGVSHPVLHTRVPRKVFFPSKVVMGVGQGKGALWCRLLAVSYTSPRYLPC